MSEFRKDPVTGRWVIIATERQKRPSDFRIEPTEPRPAHFCPFCAGSEDKTPHEVLAYRHNGGPPNSPGWDVRVVPNHDEILLQNVMVGSKVDIGTWTGETGPGKSEEKWVGSGGGLAPRTCRAPFSMH